MSTNKIKKIELVIGDDWIIPAHHTDENDVDIDLSGRTITGLITFEGGSIPLTVVEVDYSLGQYNLTCDDTLTIGLPTGQISELRVKSELSGFNETLFCLSVDGVLCP